MKMPIRSLFCATVVVFLTSNIVLAQPLKTGNYLTLKFDERLFSETVSDFMGENTRLVAEFERMSDGRMVYSGREDWPRASLLSEHYVSRVSYNRRCACTNIEVGYVYTLRLKNVTLQQLPEVLPLLALRGKATETQAVEYIVAERKAAAERMFSGELEGLPTPVESALMGLVMPAPLVRGGRVGFAEFKSERYLELQLPEATTVYNTLKLNQAARLAQVVNSDVLTRIRTVVSHLGSLPSVAGIKVATRVHSKSFAAEYAEAAVEDVQILVPVEAARKFAAAELTSQQMLQASVVIVDGNRVEVNLSQ